jgi:hypothetical protein
MPPGSSIEPWTPGEMQLLAVTLRLLREYGYDRLSVDAVATQAKASIVLMPSTPVEDVAVTSPSTVARCGNRAADEFPGGHDAQSLRSGRSRDQIGDVSDTVAHGTEIRSAPTNFGKSMECGDNRCGKPHFKLVVRRAGRDSGASIHRVDDAPPVTTTS